MTARSCPALAIAAPASGQGKTTVTAALARFHRDRGRRVRVFKVGPDFLDPMVLERACGEPVYQLDLWMGGEEHCRELLHRAAGEADLILVEGVMGLFDGQPSTADLAMLFGIPVLAVIDASAMAQSFGAIAHGLATYRSGLPFAGVFANRVAGAGHYALLASSLPPGVTGAGWLAQADDIALPERHLGLVQADEVADLEHRIGMAADALGDVAEALAPPVRFNSGPVRQPPALLANTRIAVARDNAFAFVYRANLDLLRSLGAELVFFSPLAERVLPNADALYLPGGYPELHVERLAGNSAMKAEIRMFHRRGRPIVAECGGMLYLLGSLRSPEGVGASMAGLLPGSATVKSQLSNLGLHEAELPEGRLRGHTFHHSVLHSDATPLTHSLGAKHHGREEAIYRVGRLTASYMHWYFPSNPEAAARLFLP